MKKARRKYRSLETEEQEQGEVDEEGEGEGEQDEVVEGEVKESVSDRSEKGQSST